MELVRKLPASHHFASHPAGSAGDADVYAEEGGDGVVHNDKAPPRL